jgi:putative Holliday junction resolvase
MRYLGIDYGSKRIGLALSDETKTIVTPLSVLSNDKNTISELLKVCQKNEVEVVVVGESKNYDQVDNNIMKEARPFVDSLKNTLGIPVYFHPEFLTSREAEHIQGKNNMLDASAAALILKSYLDTNKK